MYGTDLQSRATNNIQIGLTELPEDGSPAHLELVRQWLQDCDDDHVDSHCHAAKTERMTARLKKLPKRFIDVGKVGEAEVHLREPGDGNVVEWVALSHRWGSGPHYSTNRKNLDSHVKGIEVESLPATFRDAITVTRALGIQYLWVDSLCIVQGPGGDFNQEAKRMEDVYSGAYCVIAASRATGHYSGFLGERKARDYVGLQGEGENEAPFYICEMIDDFSGHVLAGEMNRRGWVLQEHALARRTIFFTEHQTYFECGEGVRCQTLTKMKK